MFVFLSSVCLRHTARTTVTEAPRLGQTRQQHLSRVHRRVAVMGECFLSTRNRLECINRTCHVFYVYFAWRRLEDCEAPLALVWRHCQGHLIRSFREIISTRSRRASSPRPKLIFLPAFCSARGRPYWSVEPFLRSPISTNINLAMGGFRPCYWYLY